MKKNDFYRLITISCLLGPVMWLILLDALLDIRVPPSIIQTNQAEQSIRKYFPHIHSSKQAMWNRKIIPHSIYHEGYTIQSPEAAITTSDGYKVVINMGYKHHISGSYTKVELNKIKNYTVPTKRADTTYYFDRDGYVSGATSFYSDPVETLNVMRALCENLGGTLTTTYSYYRSSTHTSQSFVSKQTLKFDGEIRCYTIIHDLNNSSIDIQINFAKMPAR